MSEANKNEINFFAKTNFRNRDVPFGIKADDRRRHMYVIGKTGMGKTTLMENMAIQDIVNGHGVCFIDPHGDSVAKILDFVPNSRINDVIYFNPADLEYPIAFNILEAVDTKYKHLVASGLMGVFTKIWANMWSARMEYILNNTILALLESPGNTMLGITRMYIDKKYRKKIIDNIKDPMVRAFWTDEFANYNEKYRTEAVAPIQNKVGQFLSSGIVRNIVGQPKSTIDLRNIMDTKKILLMDLSKGKVGEDNSALLGAMIITKLQLAALSRVDIPENERADFYLYVDEFQNFATESFATILSEARKYHLNLTIGHQYIGQLTPDKGSTKIRDAVFGNVGTIICFRIGAADAEFLETEFAPIYTPNDLVNLPKYQIILKLMINGMSSEPFSANTMQVKPDLFTGNGEKVRKVSRERFANKISEVEDKISRWMGAEFHEQTAVVLNAQSQDEEEPLPRIELKESVNQPILETKEEAEKFVEREVVGEHSPIEETAKEPVNDTKQEAEQARPHSTTFKLPEAEFSHHSGEEDESMVNPKPFVGREPQAFANKNSAQRQPKPWQQNSRPNQGRFQNNQLKRPAFQRPGQQNQKHISAVKTKQSNPIWDTVANINKKNSLLEKLNSTDMEFNRNNAEDDLDSKGTVIKPGEVHKI